MSTITNKELFKEIKKLGTDLSKEDDISKSFPYFCLQVFFPNLSIDEIDTAVYGLGSDDESIDAFWVDDDKQEINIVQFKSTVSVQKAETSTAKKEWFSYLDDVPSKLMNEKLIEKHPNRRISSDIANEFIAAKRLIML